MSAARRPTARRLAAAAVTAVFASMLVAPSAPAADAPVSVLAQPVQYAAVDGAVLGYRVAGSGLPLVLIAGFSNTMAEWDPRLLDELAASRKVIVFDNRGIGTSTGDVSRLTIAQMARDTRQLIDHVIGGPTDVLGWSMGGYIAQELAIRNPARVRRLVLAATDCGGPTTVGPTAKALRILTDPSATTDQLMSILFPRQRADDAAAWLAAVGAAFAAGGYQPQNAFTVTPQVAKAQTRAAGPLWLGAGRGTCDRLGRITAPTLVSGGRDDVVVPIANRAALLAGIPDSTGRSYSVAGHAFLFQPGLGYAATVNAFLGVPQVEQRLRAAGLTVPSVVAPLAAYVPAVRTGNLVFTSGQLPIIDGKLSVTGKVGAEVSTADAVQAAQVAALNALAAIKSVVGDLDKVVRVVKVVGYVASASGFTGQPAVVNGASNLFKTAFGDAGVHARSAIGVAELPLGAPVEIEVIVEVAS